MARIVFHPPPVAHRARGACIAAACCAAALAWWWGLADKQPGAGADALRAQPPLAGVAAPAPDAGPAARPASPFGPAPGAAGADEPWIEEIRLRNAGVDVGRLTSTRPQLAEAFLAEAELRARPHGGWEVRDVDPGGVVARLGLRQGDILVTLDSAENASVDEGSMEAVIAQTTLVVDVLRGGRPVRLSADLTRDPHEAVDGHGAR